MSLPALFWAQKVGDRRARLNKKMRTGRAPANRHSIINPVRGAGLKTCQWLVSCWVADVQGTYPETSRSLSVRRGASAVEVDVSVERLELKSELSVIVGWQSSTRIPRRRPSRWCWTKPISKAALSLDKRDSRLASRSR
jgi:hypothetical protein